MSGAPFQVPPSGSEVMDRSRMGSVVSVLVEEEGAIVGNTIGLLRRSVVNTVLLGFLLLWFSEAPSAGATFGLAAAYAGLALFLRKTPDRYLLVSVAATVVSFANHLAVHVLLGGYANSGAWFAFGVVVATMASLWATRRTLIIIAGCYAVTAIVLGFFETALQSSRPPVDDALPAILFPFRMVTALILLVGLFYLSVRQITGERSRSRTLLLQLLPESVADRLKREPEGRIADEVADCTVVFADLVGFTAHSHTLEPSELLEELDSVFTAFDEAASIHGVQTIKTLGDGYMAVAGVPQPREDHLVRGCEFAMAIRRIARAIPEFHIRIGVSVGPVIAGVIGENRLAYDVWGETVNLASRLESTGQADVISVSEEVYRRVRDTYEFEPLGSVDMKGIGPTDVYELIGERQED
jgi:adenylate cyclase